MRQAAKTIDLDFPSRVQLCENDAWSKLRQVSSASQAEFTCVKKIRRSAISMHLLCVQKVKRVKQVNGQTVWTGGGVG